MFRKILLVLAAILAVLAVVIAMQPAEFRVTRTTMINAPLAGVFSQINDFKNWKQWSPWAGRDPQMQVRIDGSPAGLGAVYWWSGNSEVGEGRMTIVDSRPSEFVAIKLEFIKPFAATNRAEFRLVPGINEVEVTWTMTGENGFMGKAFSLVMDMDKMVGADFEKGLASMKAVAEGTAK